MRRDSPSSRWYDPPEPRHSDKSIIPEDCECEECHEYHDIVECYKFYKCCKEDADERAEKGEWCYKHGDSFLVGGFVFKNGKFEFMVDKPMKCTECG